MRHLQMSESEIVSSYRTARDPKRQIGILAELNAVTPREIRQVLEKLHSELWDAIKDGNEDEALVEMGAINASAAALCTAFAGMAAEAQRAVEEQT